MILTRGRTRGVVVKNQGPLKYSLWSIAIINNRCLHLSAQISSKNYDVVGGWGG